jgi:hypothetical protein
MDTDIEAALDAYGTYVMLAAVVWIVVVLPQLQGAGGTVGLFVAAVLVGLVVLDLYYQYRRVAEGRA